MLEAPQDSYEASQNKKSTEGSSNHKSMCEREGYLDMSFEDIDKND